MKNNKSVLIVAGGKRPNKKLLRKYYNECDCCIAADKGGLYLKKSRLLPDILVGDFDSIPDRTLKWFEKKDIKIHSVNQEKDETDTMLAIMLAKGVGAHDIYIIGALGGRLDHTLANISLLQYSKQKGIKAYIVDENNIAYILDEKELIDVQIGAQLSIFSITSECVFEKSSGLKYKLDGLTLKRDNPIGVSNQAIAEKVEIAKEKGQALIVLSKEK